MTGSRGLVRFIRRLRHSLGRAANGLNRILGVPDYAAYVRHCETTDHHERLLSREEFERLRLHERYVKPGSRCC